MSEWIRCPMCGALMTVLTSGHICPCCGYRVPVQTITTTTGTSAEYVQVIRCRDCKCWKPSMTDVTEHVCHWGGFRKNADDYCSWAERKEHETD